MLSGLGQKHGTDKVSHGFTDVYDKLFQVNRLEVKKVLEVGVFFGSSLKMWAEYFPNAVIYGVDSFTGHQGNGNIFPNADRFLKENTNPRIKLVVADQAKIEDLDKVISSVGDEFDIIIDDGSHLMYDQQITLGKLFKLLKNEGIYVMEDLHTSLQSGYDVTNENKTLDLFNSWSKGIPAKSKYLSDQDNEKIFKDIKSVNIFTVKQGSITGTLTHF